MLTRRTMRRIVIAALLLPFIFMQLPCLTQISKNALAGGVIQRWHYANIRDSVVLKDRNSGPVDSSSKFRWTRKTLKNDEILNEELQGSDRIFSNESHVVIVEVEWSDAGIYQRSVYDDAGNKVGESTSIRLVVMNVDCVSTCRNPAANTSIQRCLMKCETIYKKNAPEIDSKDCDNQSMDSIANCCPKSYINVVVILTILVALLFVAFVYFMCKMRLRRATTAPTELPTYRPNGNGDYGYIRVNGNEDPAAQATSSNSNRFGGRDTSEEWLCCGRIYVESEEEVLRGVAILHDIVYAVYKSAKFIDVHKKSSIDQRKKILPNGRWKTDPVYQIRISYVQDPFDLAACLLNDRLYLSDRNGNSIWRVDVGTNPTQQENGNSFAIVESPLKLSTTPVGNLCVCFPDHTIKVFSPDGILTVKVTMPDAVLTPSHACSAGESGDVCFFVAYFDHFTSSSEQHRVCLVSKEGKTRNRFGGRPGNGVGETNRPSYIVREGDGGIFVAEWDNDRIIKLDENLSREQKVIFRGCVRPRCMAYSNSHTDKLLVIGTYHNGIYLCRPPTSRNRTFSK